MNDYKSIRELCRELRKNQTPSESLLWSNLRNRKLDGLKFVRQYPVIYGDVRKTEFFIVDFYCAEKKLIIELDGKIHETQKEYDRERDKILTEMGYSVIRFKNEELKNVPAVLAKIKAY